MLIYLIELELINHTTDTPKSAAYPKIDVEVDNKDRLETKL